MSRPRVLLTNDDGPPSPKESPYILGLYLHLRNTLGWEVKVVLPSSQNSWIGKAFHIKEITTGRYYYPRVDGSVGRVTQISRPLEADELAEWVLLDGTPATCTNVALYNLYPGQIDLVVSGPNYGRNTSTAFAMSSGTIGAALSASISGVRSIAISYGTVLHPTPAILIDPAHQLGTKVIKKLWDNWGQDHVFISSDIDLYSINIPLIHQLLSVEGMKICWTHMWRNSYERLFQAVPDRAVDSDSVNAPTLNDSGGDQFLDNLRFRFAPDIAELVSPAPDVLPVGSDSWALHQGWASVTPLQATFGEPSHPFHDPESRLWKL